MARELYCAKLHLCSGFAICVIGGDPGSQVGMGAAGGGFYKLCFDMTTHNLVAQFPLGASILIAN